MLGPGAFRAGWGLGQQAASQTSKRIKVREDSSEPKELVGVCQMGLCLELSRLPAGLG